MTDPALLPPHSVPRRILIIEDDPLSMQALTDALQSSGYRVWCAASGQEGRALLPQIQPDLIVLDLLLPDEDGLLLCANLKADVPRMPILICSGTPEQRAAVLGLKLGADDFIRKPFDIYELEARVEAILRRTPPPTPPVSSETVRDPGEIRLGSLVIQGARRQVTLGGRLLPLTPTEYRLLYALASRPNEIVTRAALALAAWGTPETDRKEAISVWILRLRAKLAPGAVAVPAITSVRGFGYMLRTA